MHLVAVIAPDPRLALALARFRDPLGRFHLHPLRDAPTESVLAGLAPLEFAGALLLDEQREEGASRLLQRSSLEAQEVGAVDTVTVSAGGLIGEYNAGRAVGSLLSAAGWDGRGANAVILGSSRRAAAVARELSSLGVRSLALLAASRPAAEKAVSRLAASTTFIARAFGDPLTERLLAEADLLVRVDPQAPVPLDALGPHLSLVDLSPEPVTRLRQQALNVGALSFNLRDFQAHLLALALSHVLGGRIELEPLLALLHEPASY